MPVAFLQRRTRPTAIALAFLAFTCAADAWGAADPHDVLQLVMTAGLLEDDNLFRIPDGDSRVFGVDPDRRSDRITRIGAGIRFDKTVSRQRVLANVNLEHNPYEHNSTFDHTAGNAGARWLWAAGHNWNGEVAYERRRRMTAFENLGVLDRGTRNMVDSNIGLVSGGYRLYPRWRAWGSLDFLETSNSVRSFTQNDIDLTAGTLGVEYRTPAENSIGLQLRYAEGQFPNRESVAARLVNNAFTETNPAVTILWNSSAKSYFDGRLGYTTRTHEQFSARDFSGPTYRAHYRWAPTLKLSFDADASRELVTAETDTSSYVVVSGLRLVSTWAATSKITARGALTHVTRSYDGDPLVVLGAQVREDVMRTFQLGLAYALLRSVEFRLLLEKGTRDSNLPQFQYDYESALLNLSLIF